MDRLLNSKILKSVINQETPFYILLVLYILRCFFNGMVLYDFESIGVTYLFLRLTNLLIIICLFLNIFVFKVFKKKDFLFIIPITVILFMSNYISGINALFKFWLIILGSRIFDFKQFVKRVFIILLCIIIPIITLSYFGYIGNFICTRDFGFITHRYSMGISNPNLLGFLMFNLAACITYFRWKKFGVLENITFFILFYVSYFVANCRTSTVLLIVLFLLINLSRLLDVEKLLNYLKKIADFSLFFLPFISFLLAYMYLKLSDLAAIIDNILQCRIRNLAFVLWNYKINFLGNILKSSSDLYHIDNCYGYCLIAFGAFVFIIFLVTYYFLIKRAYQSKNVPLLMLLGLYLYAGFMEKVLLIPVLNFTLFAISGLIHNRDIFLSKND